MLAMGKRVSASSQKVLMVQEAATKGYQQRGEQAQQLELQKEIKIGSESSATINWQKEVEKVAQLVVQKANDTDKENYAIALGPKSLIYNLQDKGLHLEVERKHGLMKKKRNWCRCQRRE